MQVICLPAHPAIEAQQQILCMRRYVVSLAEQAGKDYLTKEFVAETLSSEVVIFHHVSGCGEQ
jgi:hypothetical protein